MTFKFDEQLKDLLSNNHIFGNLDNLDVNPNNRFGKFERSDKLIDEVNSGSWYQHAYSTLILTPGHNHFDEHNGYDCFLLPIIFYIDKTGTDVMQRHGLEPLLFTTSVISRKARQDVRSWRTLASAHS